MADPEPVPTGGSSTVPLEPGANEPVLVRVACPNCGVVLDPPPARTRLCPRCRRRIVVRRFEGRTIYLTDASVDVFENERRRDSEVETWTHERRHWLQLAQIVGAPAERRRRLANAPVSAASVQASRALYLQMAERAVRVARREKHWDDVSRIRRRQAEALFEATGGTAPPDEEVLGLYREAIAATLRALAPIAREAELVGASCCAACRADSGRIFRITDELRTPRLPHTTCPRGLCACDWWPALRDPDAKRRRRARRPSTPKPPPATEA